MYIKAKKKSCFSKIKKEIGGLNYGIRNRVL